MKDARTTDFIAQLPKQLPDLWARATDAEKLSLVRLLAVRAAMSVTPGKPKYQFIFGPVQEISKKLTPLVKKGWKPVLMSSAATQVGVIVCVILEQ